VSLWSRVRARHSAARKRAAEREPAAMTRRPVAAAGADPAPGAGDPDPPVVRPRVDPTPALLRHNPFVTGFFAALGAAFAIFLLQQLAGISWVLILIVMALFLAVGLNPLVEWLMRRTGHRGFSVALVIALVLGVLTLFVMTVAPVISEQIASITRQAPGWLDDLQHNRTIQGLNEKYDVVTKVRDYITSGDFGSSVFGGALGVGLAVLSALANILIVLVLMIYFLASLPAIKQATYRLAPASRRPRVSQLGDRIIRSTGAYVSGAFVVAVCAGVSTLVFTFLVGLGDYSFALAFVVGLLSLIPVVGSVVSAVLITLLGLTVSPTVALVSLVYYLAYQQLEAYVIYPRIMARSVDVPGSVTVIAALLGGALMGIIGALLAVPVAAALLLLHREVFLTRQDSR